MLMYVNTNPASFIHILLLQSWKSNAESKYYRIQHIFTLKPLFLCLFLEVKGCSSSMVLWPVLVLWLPRFTFLQPSPYLAATFQFNVWSKSVTSLQTALSFLPLGFPTGLLPLQHPPIAVLGIHESSILTTWTAHCSLFWCRNAGSTMSSHDLWIMGGSYWFIN